MDITISDLKDVFKNHSSGDQHAVGSAEHDYDFEGVTSRTLYPNLKIRLVAVLCLHRRNYRPILIDSTGSIYIEFFICNKSASSINSKLLNRNNSSNDFIRKDFFNKEITIELFNVFTERINIANKYDESLSQKVITYLQADMSKCGLNLIEEPRLDVNYLTHDDRISFLKTQELKKLVEDNIGSTMIVDEIVDDTMDTDSSFGSLTSLFVLDIDKNTNDKYYLIKIVAKGNIKAMINVRNESKLTAEFLVELHPLYKTDREPIHIILVLQSKFLYYYNILYCGNNYLIKTNEPIHKSINNIFKPTKNCPSGMLYINETIVIIDEFDLVNYEPQKVKSLSDVAQSSARKDRSDYVHQLSGTLIEKKLKTNSSVSSTRTDCLGKVLLEHFEIVLVNLEFKFVIRLDDEAGTLATIYDDSKLYSYPFGILPGMEIRVYDLIKRQDNTYKSNSTVSACLHQNFDLLDERSHNEPDKPSQQHNPNIPKRKKLYENLKELDVIFNKFYKDHEAGGMLFNSNFRLDLLFKNKSENTSRSLKILAQIIKIYELVLRIKCKICGILASSCCCYESLGMEKLDINMCVIELNATFLIDDHTSVIRVQYSNYNYDFKGHDSQLFGPIGPGLKQILFKYLNEIKMPNIPIYFNTQERSGDQHELSNNMNKQIIERIKEQLHKNESTTGHSKFPTNMNIARKQSTASDFENIDDFFENNVKPDIYKTIYDYVVNCVIDKYFVFYVDGNLCNELSRGKRDEVIRNKISSSLFKLSSVSTNEQFKSMFTMKCFKFLPNKILN